VRSLSLRTQSVCLSHEFWPVVIVAILGAAVGGVCGADRTDYVGGERGAIADITATDLPLTSDMHLKVS
jgi:hypothetical protein